MDLEGLRGASQQEEKWFAAAEGYPRPRGLEFPATDLVTPMGQHTAESSPVPRNDPTAFQDE